MKLLTDLLIIIVALEHCFFLVLEMFLWDKPTGKNIFRHSNEFAKQTATLAANQGLYNGFLAAGLFWSFFSNESREFQLFFLSCIIIAGIYGAISVSKLILWIQAFPATIALGLLLYISN